MDRSVILSNVVNMTAEQLFDKIKSGIVTLDDLMRTGELDIAKRRKIESLLNQNDSIDNEDWERARYSNELGLSDYITKHPTGKYVLEAKQKIDLLERQRANEIAQRETILKELKRNPSKYPPGKIIEYLRNSIITEKDLLECGIPDSAIQNLHNIVTPYLQLGNTPESVPPGFTEVYFWGYTGSGKTCALGAILQMAHKKGYLNFATGPGYQYAHQLMNIFSDDGMANDYLPAPTPLENTQYLPFTLKKPNERSSRSVSLIELSGEIYKCFFKINAGIELESQLHINTFHTLNSFLNNNNRKIHFFFVDYNRENRPDENGLTQSDYLSAASLYFKNNKIFGKSTDAIFIVLTKSDLLIDDSGTYVSHEERVKYAKKYLNENNYKSFIETLKYICEKESINSGVLTVEPFSLGKVYFQKICDFEGSSASAILEILMDRIPTTQNSILDVFNR